MPKQDEWLKDAQHLAEMVRELRKAELHVEELKENIHRWLRTRGCCRSVPWRTARRDKNERDARVGPLSDQPDQSRSGAEGVLQHERNGTIVNVAFADNGKPDQLNGHAANGRAAKVFRDDSQ